ncbi:MAG: flagellar assembly protein FliH [Treponema sp.]|jgi:flagellar assembly protein FliH|nr:flagellar assembly protein FliH [Treponema sp.]
MAKAVFRPGELLVIPEKIMLCTPLYTDTASSTSPEAKDDDSEPEAEQYTGPTAEDLRREAEAFIVQWNEQKETMIKKAGEEATAIVEAANQAAAEEKERSCAEADALKTAAQEEAEKITAEARRQAEELAVETRKTLDDERNTAVSEGKEAGRLEGYAEGRAEVERLIQRTQVVLERAQDKRGEILTETEQEIINLVLRITRKVVKVISESQREVIISNVVQALRKVRDRGNIIIHVNLADLKLATEHTKDFIRMLEGAKSIQVVEDSSVDAGGCIIETDFGEIDARISSQLTELESKITEISPIKAKAKPASSGK